MKNARAGDWENASNRGMSLLLSWDNDFDLMKGVNVYMESVSVVHDHRIQVHNKPPWFNLILFD
jgi:hypothetical protein